MDSSKFTPDQLLQNEANMFTIALMPLFLQKDFDKYSNEFEEKFEEFLMFRDRVMTLLLKYYKENGLDE